jgi:LmbE family N-acetylglucosaminyl deacetylase
VVVAHPDDETLGIGGQLTRMPAVTIVHVTDGAPRDLRDARRLGFATVQDYAAARRRELEAAMALAGIGPGALVGLGVPDQGAARELSRIARRLAALFVEREIETIFTHAYEGGHPDHDATAFATRAAADLVLRRAGARIVLIEMPYYRAAPDGWVVQQFVSDPNHPELALALDERQRDLKRRMLAAHASQADMLGRFPVEVERFRPAPHHEFNRLPPGDGLLYERHDWGLSGAQWLDLAEQARRALALDTAVTP